MRILFILLLVVTAIAADDPAPLYTESFETDPGYVAAAGAIAIRKLQLPKQPLLSILQTMAMFNPRPIPLKPRSKRNNRHPAPL